MLSERLLGAFDDQIELEFYSAHALPVCCCLISKP